MDHLGSAVRRSDGDPHSMSLKLISDNTVELPVGNVRDIAGMLRLLADDVEAGVHGELTSLVTIAVQADGIALAWYGENCSHYELMGLFEAAKLRVFADDVIED